MPTAIEKYPSTELTTDDFEWAPKFVEKNPNIFAHMSAFRWQYRNRHNNGMAEHGVAVKRGNKIYVCKPRVAYWLASAIDEAA